MSDKDVSEIQRMIPRRDFVNKWKHLEHDAQELAKKLNSKEAATNSGAWKLLTSTAPERILFLSLTTRQSAVDQKIKNFMTKWRQVREKLPFAEMAEMRITPQLPEYSKISDEAFLLLLDGKLRSHTEIVNFLKPYEPPPPPPPPAPKRGRSKAVAVEAAPAAAAANASAVPAKRGRKPKTAAAVAPPGPVVAAVPAATAIPAKATSPAKSVVVASKPAPAKAAKKESKPAKKAVSVKAKPVAKKTVAKKATAKKPAAKKATAKKPSKKKR